VRRDLDAFGVPYEVVPTLVRGLDYYTRTTWEFVGPALGAQSTISGGGRYDGLVQEIGGAPTPGVGFGAGIERLVLALEEAGVSAEAEPPELFFLFDGGADRCAALVEVAKLRQAGVACDADYAGRSLKGQWTQLSRSGARGYVLVREDGAVLKRGHDAVEEPVGVGEIAARYLS
jgi:histidyl-tRNA synthetase